MLIHPQWSAPDTVAAAMTTRHGGVSLPPFDALNLGYATSDARDCVAENERRTALALGVPLENFRWVYQVHGAIVHRAEDLPMNAPLGATTIQGDAVVSHTPGLVCAVKVADCMPVLLAAADGSAVAAAHAGWRGMAGRVIENTVAAMRTEPSGIVAWLGPSIGPTAFEVGDDVRDAFMAQDPGAAVHFVSRQTAGKYLCDLPALARRRLAALGVQRVFDSGNCTLGESDRFFSHRRDKVTGRMAAFIWIRDASAPSLPRGERGNNS